MPVTAAVSQALSHHFTCVRLQFTFLRRNDCANVNMCRLPDPMRAGKSRRREFWCDIETRGCRGITLSRQRNETGEIDRTAAAAEGLQGLLANQKSALSSPSDLSQTHPQRDKRHFQNRDACFLEHDQRVLSPHMNQHQISSRKETKNLLF